MFWHQLIRNFYISYLFWVITVLKQFGFCSGFMRSDEFPAAEDLIDAYKSGDEEKFSNAKNNRALKYVDISIARLVKSLVLEPQPVLDAEVDLNADFSMADGASAVQLEKKEVDGEIDLT